MNRETERKRVVDPEHITRVLIERAARLQEYLAADEAQRRADFEFARKVFEKAAIEAGLLKGPVSYDRDESK